MPTDVVNGRQYLTFEDGTRSYFPTRVPKTIRFDINDQYARLFADNVVDDVNGLELPRYGFGNYVRESPPTPPSQAEAKALNDLSRAGKRLMGFCRTNLFKRLESSGHSFLLSVERHVLRNFIFLHAIEHDRQLPIGTTDSELLDSHSFDEDAATGDLFDTDDNGENGETEGTTSLKTEEDFRKRAAEVYALYAWRYKKRFRWLASHHFVAKLLKDLMTDATTLRNLLVRFRQWHAAQDAKLHALEDLLVRTHSDRKVLVFTQFADTVRYLEHQLKAIGVPRIAAVTGDSADPTRLAWRFSPTSKEKGDHVSAEEELRVLVATDVLSEG